LELKGLGEVERNMTTEVNYELAREGHTGLSTATNKLFPRRRGAR